MGVTILLQSVLDNMLRADSPIEGQDERIDMECEFIASILGAVSPIRLTDSSLGPSSLVVYGEQTPQLS